MASSRVEIHEWLATENPMARRTLPKYKGFRVKAYGPEVASCLCLRRCPAAYPRRSNPRIAIPTPQSSHFICGRANQNAAMPTGYPTRTRHRIQKFVVELKQEPSEAHLSRPAHLRP